MSPPQSVGPFYAGRSAASVGRERTGEVNVGGTFYGNGAGGGGGATAAPLTSFAANNYSPNPGDVVTFTDTSTGTGANAATAWNWIFADGSTSTQQNPTHVFTLPCCRTVTLIASNSFGAGNTASRVVSVATPATSSLINLNPVGSVATSSGTPVTDQFSAQGFTFSGAALAFHTGTLDGQNDPLGAVTAPPSGSGYARTAFAGSGYGSFQITVDPTKHFKQVSMYIAAAVLAVEIYAYDQSGNILNTGIHLFSNAGGFAWSATPYVLVDGSASTDIQRITFNYSTRGLFAISGISFSSPAGPCSC